MLVRTAMVVEKNDIYRKQIRSVEPSLNENCVCHKARGQVNKH
jgi:hypothetical protein